MVVHASVSYGWEDTFRSGHGCRVNLMPYALVSIEVYKLIGSSRTLRKHAHNRALCLLG